VPRDQALDRGVGIHVQVPAFIEQSVQVPAVGLVQQVQALDQHDAGSRIDHHRVGDRITDAVLESRPAHGCRWRDAGSVAQLAYACCQPGASKVHGAPRRRMASAGSGNPASVARVRWNPSMPRVCMSARRRAD
jgi:hypothetical protein